MGHMGKVEQYTEFEETVSSKVSRSVHVYPMNVGRHGNVDSLEITLNDVSQLPIADLICDRCQLKGVCRQSESRPNERQLMANSAYCDPFADPEWTIVHDPSSGRWVKRRSFGDRLANPANSENKLGESLCTTPEPYIVK